MATADLGSSEISDYAPSGALASYSAFDEVSGYNDSVELYCDAFSHAGTSVSRSSLAGSELPACGAFARLSDEAVSYKGALRSVHRGRTGYHEADLDSDSVQGTLLGRFRIVGVLGAGQSATVYRAYDPVLERDVALKLPRRGDVKTAKSLERFLGEARALARLRHPRIVPVYDAGRAGDSHFIAMALIEGRSLADRLRDGPLGYQLAAGVIAELADALSYAHEQGVVHRDVKPANIHLNGRDEIYLMDFGIAYRPDSGEVPVPAGTILGTPAYVAPEQAKGGQTDVLPASDQYSLGAVFYELLCGQPPFSGPPSYVLFHVIHHAPPALSEIAPRVPAELAAVCLKALAKRPEDRYLGCRELAEDVRRWLRGETPIAYRRSRTRLGR
jgi:eukaryotic-like serine/threonine-protein kinase